MARFEGLGSDALGRRERGECEASGLIEAAAQLRSRGFAPLSLHRMDPVPAEGSLPGADAFTLFNRQLAEMTKLGLPLPRALHEIVSGLRRGRFRTALEKVEASLREGKGLDEAVGDQPGAFPPYYRWMLKAGAGSGNLASVLSAVARNSEGLRLARRALVEATAYPLVILGFAFLSLLSALFLVLPYFQELYQRHAFEFPATLSFLLAHFGSFPVFLTGCAGMVAGGWGLLRFLRHTLPGQKLAARIPLLGRIHQHLRMARLMGVLSVLLKNHTPLDKALPVALGASGGLELERAGERLAARAAEGLGLGALLAEAPGIPSEVAAYLSLAERTGSAAQAAGDVAELLTEQARAESEKLLLLLVPLALLVAGVGVALLLVPLAHSYVGFVEKLNP